MNDNGTFPVYFKIQSDNSGLAELERNASSTISSIRAKFEKDVEGINRVLDSALSRPRSATGGLDLGAAEMRKAAEAAKVEAIGLRELATAAQRAALATGDQSESTRRYVQAARAAAVEREGQARALNAEATAHERLQLELNKSTSATGTYIRGAGVIAEKSNQVRFATLGATQQIQDIGISLYSGQRAGTVFAQQLPQLAFALSGLEGSANKTAARIGQFATFLSGPWGIAVGLAVGVLGGMIGRLFESGDAADELSKKTISLEAALSAQRFGTVEATKALAEYNKKEGEAAQTDALATDRAIALAKARLQEALALRGVIKARIESQREAASVPGAADETGALALTIRQQDDALKAQIARIGDLKQTLRNLGIEAATKTAKAAADPIEAINQRYERMAAVAIRAARGNDKLNASLAATLSNIERQKKAAQDSVRDGRRQGSGSISSDAPTQAQLRALIRQEIPGARVTSGQRTRAQQQVLYDRYLAGKGPLAAKPGTSAHEFGRAIDIAKSPSVTLESVKAALARRGVKIAEILDEGKHIHVAVAAGRGALQDYAEDAKLAAQAQEDLARDLDIVLQKFDPAAKAASDYAEQLARIDRLASSGQITSGQAVTYTSQAILDETARNVRAANDNARDFYAKIGVDPLKEMRDIVDGIGEVRIAQEEAAAQAYSQNLGSALDGVASIFGVKTARLLDILSRGAAPDKGVNPVLAAFGSGKSEFNTQLKNGLNDTFNKVFGNTGPFAKTLGRTLAAAQTGQGASDIFSSITGSKGSSAGSAIGGALGEAVGKKLFKKLGDFAGPLGSIAGGILGGMIGGLLSKPKTGVATIGGSGNTLKVSSITGNSSKFKQAAGSSADAAISTLEGLVDQLGGTLNASRGSVSIGIRDGKYRVDPTGSGQTKKKKGAIDFGEDANAAVKAATLDLIKDGVIEGLRASTQRILQTGKDLDSAISKALRFEGVFTRLKQFTDPVGAAIDALDKEFVSLKRIFAEAGASAAEYADLESLYQKERAKAVEEASAQMTSALRGLLDELQTGDNGRSLRDRLSSALANYNPLATDIAAGKTVDYDKFAEAARIVLDIQRQISGSQTDYFTRLDEVTNLTKNALAGQENIISIASARTSPLGTLPTVEPVVSAIDTLNASIVAAINSQSGATNQNLGTLIELFRQQKAGNIPYYDFAAVAGF